MLAVKTSQPSYCQASVSKDKAAADQYPDLYQEDGAIDWSHVSTGWNTECGPQPSNFTDTEVHYGEEIGRPLRMIRNASGFQNNAFSPFSKSSLLNVVAIDPVSGFPFGERPQAFQSGSRIFSANLFYMPTTTAESVYWVTGKFAICAYFESDTTNSPSLRIYKTVYHPVAEPLEFLQEFKQGDVNAPMTISYEVTSRGYSDDGSIGKARFTMKDLGGCPVWSQSHDARPVMPIFWALTMVLVLSSGVLGYLVFRAYRARKEVSNLQRPEKSEQITELRTYSAQNAGMP